MDIIFWLVMFVIFLVAEILTLGLTTIWFAGGAVVSFILALCDVSLPIQIIAFLVVSIVLLILTRPIALRFFNQNREKTNVDSLIGQKAVVLENIDSLHGIGRVEMNGMEWSAKTEDMGTVIAQGEIVIVQAIQGVKLIVKKEEE